MKVEVVRCSTASTAVVGDVGCVDESVRLGVETGGRVLVFEVDVRRSGKSVVDAVAEAGVDPRSTDA